MIGIHLKKFASMLRKLGLKRKMILGTGTLFVGICLVCVMLMQKIYVKEIQRTNARYTMEFTNQSVQKLDQQFQELDRTAYTVAYSNWAQGLLRRENGIGYGYYESMYFLQTAAQMNQGIPMVIYGKNGICLPSSVYELPLTDRFDVAAQSFGMELMAGKRIIQYGNRAPFLRQELESPWIFVYYPVLDYANFKYIGCLIYGIEPYKLNFASEKTFTERLITVHDSQGQVIYTSDQHVLDQGEELPIQSSIDGKSYFVASQMDENTGWTITTALLSGSKENLSTSFLWLLVGIGALGLFAFFAALGFSCYLTKPIVACTNAIKRIRDNDFDIHIPNSYQDEIGELIDGINDMTYSIKILLKRNEAVCKLSSAIRFEMLCQQINPHFLYNTLDIINGLILNGQKDEAVRVCEMLGLMFRYNLNGEEDSTLEQEIDHTKQYLEIIQYKIQGLNTDLVCDESIRKLKIARFVLQPLVENSIKHGFAQKRGECLVSVCAQDEGDRISICVMDNGAGMLPQTVDKLENMKWAVQKGIPPERNQTTAGERRRRIGLRNIYERLFVKYGRSLEFRIETRQGFGTRIMIDIPKERG